MILKTAPGLCDGLAASCGPTRPRVLGVGLGMGARKEVGGGCSALRPTTRPPHRTYQHALDGEVLQASVPRGVKDHRQRLVRGLRVADLHLVLHGERGREAVTRAAWVPTPSAGTGAGEPSALSPRGVKGKCTGVIQPQKRGSGKAELTVLYLSPRAEESTRVPSLLLLVGARDPRCTSHGP